MNAKSLVNFLVVLALWLCIGCASTTVMAQIGGNGSIQGLVTDPGGAVVPGATVVATNTATGVETSKQTNAAGVYVIAPLPPGEYKVVV
ncbi:MAG TPA: carboxypeptidase-like regulatory domain-containing protein, partial [Pyrinomonadaceae bacterium]|nr:carboxypeptidase-like regulatory domain-containing protein [Pyrinomonadaceae bacterium]